MSAVSSFLPVLAGAAVDVVAPEVGIPADLALAGGVGAGALTGGLTGGGLKGALMGGLEGFGGAELAGLGMGALGAGAGGAAAVGGSTAPMAGTGVATGLDAGAGAAMGGPMGGAGAVAAPAAVADTSGPLSLGGAATLPTAASPTAFDTSMATLGPSAATAPAAAAGSTGGGIGSFFSRNPLMMLPMAGLAMDAMSGNQMPKGYNQLKGIADQQAGQSQQLESYLTSGQLPPGLQGGINTAADQAKASIRSQYAARGMSGSSAEQQDLANVENMANEQGAKLAIQLYQTGVSEAGMTSQIYQYLMQNQLQRDQQLGQSLGLFSMALASGAASQ